MKYCTLYTDGDITQSAGCDAVQTTNTATGRPQTATLWHVAGSPACQMTASSVASRMRTPGNMTDPYPVLPPCGHARRDTGCRLTSRKANPATALACGGYHLLTPSPRLGRQRLRPLQNHAPPRPPEPGPRHVCSTSDRHKPGHPEYRRCSMRPVVPLQAEATGTASPTPRSGGSANTASTPATTGPQGTTPDPASIEDIPAPQAHPPHAPPLAPPQLATRNCCITGSPARNHYFSETRTVTSRHKT